MSSIYQYENNLKTCGYKCIAGVDEVGRGAWAGPLVAAAVVLPMRLNGLRDSKVLKVDSRLKLYDRIISRCVFGIGVAEIFEINQYGLTWANQHAMKRAINSLEKTPDHLLIDYIKLPKSITQINQTPITNGDALSASIAAASIVAKVTRDRLMCELHKADNEVQHFSFNKNYGYGTRHHQEKLMEHGPTRYHRQFYTPVVESRQTRIALD